MNAKVFLAVLLCLLYFVNGYQQVIEDLRQAHSLRGSNKGSKKKTLATFGYDDRKLPNLYLFMIRVPGIDAKRPETKEKAILEHLQQISDLQESLPKDTKTKLWIQSDFVPFDDSSLRTLLYFGQKYGLYIDVNGRDTSFVKIGTLAKYISRLYMFETVSKIQESYKNIRCIVSLPTLEPLKDWKFITQECHKVPLQFKDLDRVYGFQPGKAMNDVMLEHFKTVEINKASIQFSSFNAGSRETTVDTKKLYEVILRNAPVQQRWEFHQVIKISHLNDNSPHDKMRNADKLSQLLYRQAFFRDIRLTLLVHCWNYFMTKENYNDLLFKVEEIEHSRDTNGIEFSDGDLVYFTIEFE